jgi:hypothetical protein
MNLPFYCGDTVVTMPRFDLGEFLRVVQDYRITRALLVPPMVLALTKDPIVDESTSRACNLSARGRRRCPQNSRWLAPRGWAAKSHTATA